MRPESALGLRTSALRSAEWTSRLARCEFAVLDAVGCCIWAIAARRKNSARGTMTAARVTTALSVALLIAAALFYRLGIARDPLCVQRAAYSERGIAFVLLARVYAILVCRPLVGTEVSRSW